MSLGPEQIEEKRPSKDERNRNPREDVIRGRANEGVVVHSDAGVLALDLALLVEIV